MRNPQRTFDMDLVFIPLGCVHIIKDRCKGCSYCIKNCPRKVLAVSEDTNEKGYHYPVIEKEEACLNCGFCEMICPELAIWSTFERNVNPKKIEVEAE